MNPATAKLYETDFYGWTKRQADNLRAKNIDDLDFENLIEEIESMGRSERRAMESRLEILFMHLLKWQYQPSFRGTSWKLTIDEQREKIADILEDNPSLTPKLQDAVARAYKHAKRSAMKETDLDETAFPSQCPWTFTQAMNANFWPEAD